MPETRILPVPDAVAGQRVDAAVARMVGISRTQAAKLASEGLIRLDGQVVDKADRVQLDSWIEVEIPDPPAPAAVPGQLDPAQVPAEQAVEIPILYSDNDIIVIDKPVGVAVHSSPGWEGPTVLASLAKQGFRISTSGIHERQGVVHRLDVGTTGVLVVAASELAYTMLKRGFRQRTISKRYTALVQGHPDPSRGTIDAPIGRHPVHDYRFAVVGDGRASITHYDTVEAFPGMSLLDITLETGRTHQIRVHMSAIHHPVVGDTTYGADPVVTQRLGLTRQWLHASQLGFTHPATGEQVVFRSEYPADLGAALAKVRAEGQ